MTRCTALFVLVRVPSLVAVIVRSTAVPALVPERCAQPDGDGELDAFFDLQDFRFHTSDESMRVGGHDAIAGAGPDIPDAERHGRFLSRSERPLVARRTYSTSSAWKSPLESRWYGAPPASSPLTAKRNGPIGS